MMLLTPEEIAGVDSQCQISGAFFPEAIAERQLRKVLEELKRIYGLDSSGMNLQNNLWSLIKRMGAEVGE